MERTRKVKVLSLCALLVAVLGLTVAFAALSQTLTINGSATVNTASWDVHFENLLAGTTGDAKISGGVLQGTSIVNIKASITKPNDVASYVFDIVNNGNINAKISSVEISKLCTLQSSVERCDWDNDGVVTQTDIDKVNDNISFILAYTGEDDENMGGVTLKKGDLLNAGKKVNATFYLAYSKFIEIDGSYNNDNSIIESTELPKRNLKFDDLNITITYEQAD